MLANHVFWWLMLFYTHVLLLLQPSVLWLSIVTFNNDSKPPPKWISREFDVSRIRPLLGGLPHLETFTRQNLIPAERVTRSGSPGCKRDQIKMRDYMDRRFTPPKRVTSLTWGPPPPCKQALSVRCWGGVIRQLACKQALLFGRASRERASEGLLSSTPRGFVARSRVLARLASLAQIGELARRLLGSLSNDDGHGNENVPQKVNSRCFKLHRSYSSYFNFSNVGDFFRSWILKECI